MFKAVVIAGGSGSRLWPLSRAGYPKQFLPLTGEATLFQETVSRLDSLNVESLVVICNEDHRFFVAEQLREINKAGSIILEPFGKNTAPAIGLAALTSEDDSLLLVLPADHIVVDNDAFVAAVSGAIPLAESGKLVTFGIVAESPRTGYGYIRRGEKVNSGYVVDGFVEKPSAELAKEYVASGNYYWNSGMFLFKASRYLEDLEKFRPDIYQACLSSLASAESDSDFLRINSKEFAMCPSESIDYAVMEQTPDAVVVPLNAGWSDIGSWSSVWEMSDKDSDGNTSEGDILLHNTRNSLVRSDGRLVAAVGVDDLIIVCTKDAVMVSHRDSDQDVKVIAQKLKEQSRSEYELHREVHRPWGKYDSVDSGGRYQVKRITVSPGAKLSVQKHHHRAEHWVVVSGAAMVSKGDNVFLLSENESTYIAAGVIHSLENPGKVPLEIIEVQTGSYLGEDDIVRFDDLYGRVSK